MIYGPHFCNPALPRAFCSRFASGTFPPACTAQLGSPVVCGGDNQTLSGFLVGSHQECIRVDDIVELSYHSIGQFADWIRDVSGAEKTGSISIILVLSAVLLGLKNMM